jgi:hypothetical protein
VRSCGEKLGHAGSLESSLSQTECSTESSTTSSDNNSVVGVVDDSVVSDGGVSLLKTKIRSHKISTYIESISLA